MTRFRLYPTEDQAKVLRSHCEHARYVWNIALEQMNYSTRTHRMPSWTEQARQLTEARREFSWLALGSNMVQQQALRDFYQARMAWCRGSHKRPKFRKKDRNNGFRIVKADRVQPKKMNRKWSEVFVPGAGRVRFRQSRQLLSSPKSYRVTQDRVGHWYISFAIAPEPTQRPGNFEVVGIDRGVVVQFACSTGDVYVGPPTFVTKSARQKVDRRVQGSKRREVARQKFARLNQRDVNRRRDFVEKVTTDLARRFDLFRVEDLRIAQMTKSAKGTVATPGRGVRAKARVNKAIMTGCWGLFVRRLEDKAPGRVERVTAAYTSQTCAVCRHVDAKSRKSQALFVCTACGHTANADVNAAQNIAAGRAVRGAEKSSALKRRPQRA